LKTEEPLSIKLLTSWKFHFGTFRAFWHNTWTCIRVS